MKHYETLALEYATALVRYHELRDHCEESTLNHGEALREDKLALREATDNMYMAHEKLNRAVLEAVRGGV